LLAFAFVVVHSHYKRAVIGPALLLALLVHTSIYGVFLAISLLAYLIADLWVDGRASRLRLLAAIVIVGVSLAAMVSYINPPADNGAVEYYRKYRQDLTAKTVMQNARIFLRVTAPIPRPELHFWNTNWTDSIAPAYIRKVIQYPVTVLCLAFAALSIIHRRTLVVLFSTGTLLLAGFSIINGQTTMRHQGQWFILLLLCYWIDRTHGDVDVRDFGRWQRMIRRFFPALIFAVQPVAVIIPIVVLLNVPFSPTPALVKQVLDARLDSSAWSAYPEALVPPVSAASGRAVYCPEVDRFERFGLGLVNSVEPTPEVVARRLAAQVEKNGSSLILFLNEYYMPSILSNLPKNITVTQLAMKPNGIHEGEANVALLLQKAQ
jgi:hypothetical protein